MTNIKLLDQLILRMTERMQQEMPGNARLLFNVYCITDDQIFSTSLTLSVHGHFIDYMHFTASRFHFYLSNFMHISAC